MRNCSTVSRASGTVTNQVLLVRGRYCPFQWIPDNQRPPQSNASCHIGRSCLEFIGQLGILGFFKSNRADHVAATLIRRHGVQQLLFSVKKYRCPWDHTFYVPKTRKNRSQAPAHQQAYGTDWAPSTSTGTFCRWASRTISLTGLTVPRTLETCVTATSRVFGSQKLLVLFKNDFLRPGLLAPRGDWLLFPHTAFATERCLSDAPWQRPESHPRLRHARGHRSGKPG